MSTAINYAVTRIMADLPRELLGMAFGRSFMNFHAQALENAVHQQVINDYVMHDLNLVIGTHDSIRLDEFTPQVVNNALIYSIPLSKTQGRHISRILSIEMGYQDQLGAVTPLDQIVNGAIGNPEKTGTANMEIVAPNTLAVYEDVRGQNIQLNVMLTNPENLSNLSPAYTRQFGKLCTLAAKHLMYVRLSIQLSDAAINGTQPNPMIRSMLDGYADAKQMYEEELNLRWRKINIFNDRKAKRRHLRAILPL